MEPGVLKELVRSLASGLPLFQSLSAVAYEDAYSSPTVLVTDPTGKNLNVGERL